MSLRDGDAYAVPAEAVAAFERDGYVHLKGKARLLLRAVQRVGGAAQRSGVARLRGSCTHFACRTSLA